MNDDNDTTASINNENVNVFDEAPTEMVPPTESQLNEETDIVGWRPSRASALFWRSSKTPNMVLKIPLLKGNVTPLIFIFNFYAGWI